MTTQSRGINMNEIIQLRNLMETIDTAFSVKTINEDWGSSDWHPILKHIDAAIEKYGLNPETIQDAANEMADSYYEDMGYASPEEAQPAIVDAWKRMTETGRKLSAMFAPANESVTEADNTNAAYELGVATDADGDMYVELLVGTQSIATMSADVWEDLYKQYRTILRKMQGPR